MSTVEYARHELELICHENEPMQQFVNKNILEIVEQFSEQGHSGSSASYTIFCLERLLRFKPLSPLTGAEDEWNDLGHGRKQNKRCSSVFRNENGTYNDIDAKVISEDGGLTWYSCVECHKQIEFPYMPPTHPEKIYVEDVNGHYENITDKPERIKALHERKLIEYEERDELS